VHSVVLSPRDLQSRAKAHRNLARGGKPLAVPWTRWLTATATFDLSSSPTISAFIRNTTARQVRSAPCTCDSTLFHSMRTMALVETPACRRRRGVVVELRDGYQQSIQQ